MNEETTPASPFEAIRRNNQAGNEFWSGRDLAAILGYADYQTFEQAIVRAKAACFDVGRRIEDHFVEVTEVVCVGAGIQRTSSATFLSRYGCYLVIQSADASKEAVSVGQAYFAVQAGRLALSPKATDEERRSVLREETKLHSVKLVGAVKDAGVIEPDHYSIFQDHDFRGLYGVPPSGRRATPAHARRS